MINVTGSVAGSAADRIETRRRRRRRRRWRSMLHRPPTRRDRNSAETSARGFLLASRRQDGRLVTAAADQSAA